MMCSQCLHPIGAQASYRVIVKGENGSTGLDMRLCIDCIARYECFPIRMPLFHCDTWPASFSLEIHRDPAPWEIAYAKQKAAPTAPA